MSGIKKGKELDLIGWKDLIKEYPNKPEGYSSAEEITKKSGMDRSTISEKLRRLRAVGKIKCMQVKGERGKIIWVYKD